MLKEIESEQEKTEECLCITEKTKLLFPSQYFQSKSKAKPEIRVLEMYKTLHALCLQRLEYFSTLTN